MNKRIFSRICIVIGVDILLIIGLLSLGIRGGAEIMSCILVSLPIITIIEDMIEELVIPKIEDLFEDED